MMHIDALIAAFISLLLGPRAFINLTRQYVPPSSPRRNNYCKSLRPVGTHYMLETLVRRDRPPSNRDYIRTTTNTALYYYCQTY